MAMGKIIREDEDERREDIQHGIRMKRRAHLFGCVRGVFVLLFLVTAAYFVYTYREDFGDFYNLNQNDQVQGKASTALQTARQNAAYRDKVVDDASK